MTAIKEMTNEKLISETQGIYSTIHNFECYSVNDLTYLELLQRELENRGFELKEVKTLEINEPDPDEEEIIEDTNEK